MPLTDGQGEGLVLIGKGLTHLGCACCLIPVVLIFGLVFFSCVLAIVR